MKGVKYVKKEKSCGAVVFRRSGSKPEILLIRHRNGGHWAFPKGHVEKNETEIQTALREIKEETGLEVKLDPDFRRTVTYSPSPNVMKDVVYFAAMFSEGDPVAQPEEVMDIRWETPESALRLITFANDREVLNDMIKYLADK